jgi:hypothetical protein
MLNQFIKSQNGRPGSPPEPFIASLHGLVAFTILNPETRDF